MTLSARQAITALKQSITSLISGEVAGNIAKAGFKDEAFVQEMIVAILKKWDVASGNLNLELLLSEEEKEKFQQFVATKYKELLDIPLTMEYLETKGIPVMSYKSETIPMFFTRESKYKAPMTVNSPKEIADIIKVNETLGFNMGSLICNPIPEEYSLDGEYIEKEIEKAIEEMNKLGIKGKEVTPFLLSKIVKLTEGKSLEANIALIKNNAYLAGLIAKELL